jgi:hypothetical protein
MFFVITHPKTLPTAVSSILDGKNYAQNNYSTRKYLASELIKNFNYINERQAEAAGVPDFYNVVVQLTNVPSHVTVEDINEVIFRWAKKSRVTGARGDRISVISQATSLSPSMIFPLALGTAVIYNHRRATLNHSRDLTEFHEDKAELLTRFSKLDVNIDVAVTHEKFLLPAATGLHATPYLPAPTTILIPAVGNAPVLDRALDYLKKRSGNSTKFGEIATALGLQAGTNEYKLLSKKLGGAGHRVTDGYYAV